MVYFRPCVCLCTCMRIYMYDPEFAHINIYIYIYNYYIHVYVYCPLKTHILVKLQNTGAPSGSLRHFKAPQPFLWLALN